MENKFTPELIEKARQAKSVEELLALAKENEIELTEDEAKAYFEQLNKSGELSDDELDNVAGGGCFSDMDNTPEEEKMKQRYQGKRVQCRYASCPLCGSNQGIVKKAWADKEKWDFWCEVYCCTHQNQLIVKTAVPENDLIRE